jgi:hypothetical protein
MINLGVVSFDVFIPGDIDAPGINVFDISNFTGDPNLNGFALPPDFPVLDFLTFQGASLTLTSNGTPTMISLGDIGPGFLSPTDPVQFPDTTEFESAEFDATLLSPSFTLSDGTTFTVDSTNVDTLLMPSAGNSLTAGIDFAVIEVSGTVASTAPEPGGASLIGAASALLAGAAALRQKMSSIKNR